MICAYCGKPIEEGIGIYDYRTLEFKPLPELHDLPRGLRHYQLRKKYNLQDDQVFMKGEIYVQTPDGKVYHLRCYQEIGG